MSAVPLNRRPLSRDNVNIAILTLTRYRVPRPRAVRAYRRWRAGEPAEPCVYGKEQAIAVDCHCEGCIQKLCFLFFDQVAKRFGGMP